MTSQPDQERFDRATRASISTEQHLKSSLSADPLHEGPCLSDREGLQEELQRLQQCVHELLIKNHQLRILLESAKEPPGQGPSLKAPTISEDTDPTRGDYESNHVSDE
jgi:hypothetical protein